MTPMPIHFVEIRVQLGTADFQASKSGSQYILKISLRPGELHRVIGYPWPFVAREEVTHGFFWRGILATVPQERRSLARIVAAQDLHLRNSYRAMEAALLGFQMLWRTEPPVGRLRDETLECVLFSLGGDFSLSSTRALSPSTSVMQGTSTPV